MVDRSGWHCYQKIRPRTIHPWCENTKIIVDFGAIDPSAVIIFLRDSLFIIFFGFGWLQYTSYPIRSHMKMLHSSTKTTAKLWAGDRMNAAKILWKNLALLKLWRIPKVAAWSRVGCIKQICSYHCRFLIA